MQPALKLTVMALVMGVFVAWQPLSSHARRVVSPFYQPPEVASPQASVVSGQGGKLACSAGYHLVNHGGKRYCLRCSKKYKLIGDKGGLKCIRCEEGFQLVRWQGKVKCVRCAAGSRLGQSGGRLMCLK